MAGRKTEFARGLRRRSTDAENLMWLQLRARRLGGYKFKRQYPIGPYILDFVCLGCRLIIELDGGQHANSSSDAARDAWLEREGFQVLRIWNNDVLQNLPAVLEHVLHRLQPRAVEERVPSPGSGRGTG